MALSGFLFLTWRILEFVTVIPILGMLAWFGRYSESGGEVVYFILT